MSAKRKKMPKSRQEIKMNIQVYRDEADLQVSDTDDAAAVADDTSTDEPPEGDKEPAEGAEDTATDDADVTPDGSEDDSTGDKPDSDDDDLYTENEEEYIGQFGLPDDIKTTHDALKYYAENQSKTVEATQLSELDAALKAKGHGGIEQLRSQLDGTAAPAAQPAQEKDTYVSATDTLNNNIKSGAISQEEANLILPMAQHQDETTRMLGETLRIIYDEVQSLKQGQQTVVSKQGDADYRSFVKESKKAGIRPLKKDELDKVMQSLPGDNTYFHTQAFILMRDPNKMKHQLEMMASKVKKKNFKEFRRKDGKFLKGKGRPDKRSGKSYGDYRGSDGNVTKEFHKLSSEEQHCLTMGLIDKEK